MTNQEIIRALRCTSTVYTEEVDCSECPFRTVARVPEAIIAEFGCAELESCDSDRICQIAAERLEQIEETGVRFDLLGKTVYFLIRDLPDFYPETNGQYICEARITTVSVNGFSTSSEGDPSPYWIPYSEIGESAFLSRKEAEEVLEGGIAND